MVRILVKFIDRRLASIMIFIFFIFLILKVQTTAVEYFKMNQAVAMAKVENENQEMKAKIKLVTKYFGEMEAEQKKLEVINLLKQKVVRK